MFLIPLTLDSARCRERLHRGLLPAFGRMERRVGESAPQGLLGIPLWVADWPWP